MRGEEWDASPQGLVSSPHGGAVYKIRCTKLFESSTPSQITFQYVDEGARGSVVGSGTMLQTGRSRVRITIK
jgi:hypothetical protein